MPENTIISSSANYSRQLDQTLQRLQTEGSRATQADEALISKDSLSEPVKNAANTAKEAQALTLNSAQQVNSVQFAAATQSPGVQQPIASPTTRSTPAPLGETPAAKTSADLQVASAGLDDSPNDSNGTRASAVGNDKFSAGRQESRGTLIDIFS